MTLTKNRLTGIVSLIRGGLYLYFSDTDQIFMEVLKLETQEADDNSQSREYSGPYGTVDREESYQDTYHRNVHYVDFSKWYVRLAAGLIVFFIIFLLMSLFFGIIGLAGWVLSYIWPVLLILMIFWMFKGPGR